MKGQRPHRYIRTILPIIVGLISASHCCISQGSQCSCATPNSCPCQLPDYGSRQTYTQPTKSFFAPAVPLKVYQYQQRQPLYLPSFKQNANFYPNYKTGIDTYTRATPMAEPKYFLMIPSGTNNWDHSFAQESKWNARHYPSTTWTTSVPTISYYQSASVQPNYIQTNQIQVNPSASKSEPYWMPPSMTKKDKKEEISFNNDKRTSRDDTSLNLNRKKYIYNEDNRGNPSITTTTVKLHATTQLPIITSSTSQIARINERTNYVTRHYIKNKLTVPYAEKISSSMEIPRQITTENNILSEDRERNQESISSSLNLTSIDIVNEINTKPLIPSPAKTYFANIKRSPKRLFSRYPMISKIHQVCHGLVSGISWRETILTAIKKCLILRCEAINVIPHTDHSYTVVFIRKVIGYESKPNGYCMKVHPRDEYQFARSIYHGQ